MYGGPDFWINALFNKLCLIHIPRYYLLTGVEIYKKVPYNLHEWATDQRNLSVAKDYFWLQKYKLFLWNKHFKTENDT